MPLIGASAQKWTAPIWPLGPVLHSVFDSPPPFSSPMTRIFPSAVTSDWCEMSISRDGSVSPVRFGMIEIVFTTPLRTLETSTIHVALIAATKAVFPSFEKWTSCGRQSPAADDPSGRFMTTHVTGPGAAARASHLSAVRFDSSIRRYLWIGKPVLASSIRFDPTVTGRRSKTSTAQSEQQLDDAIQVCRGFTVWLWEPPGGLARHVGFVSVK